jgi:stearoyl-CoA desaturase (delta-9 desaturase)
VLGTLERPVVPAFSARHIAFIVPLILLHLGCLLVFAVGWSGPAIMIFAVTAALQTFGITAGFHRLLTHRAYKTSRGFQLVLAVLGVLAGQNGPLWWVGHHRHHHAHSDRPDDTHSPRAGLLWSHMGWLFSPDCVPVRRELVADLAALPEMRFLERHYYVVVLGYAALLYALGGWWQAVHPEVGVTGAQLVVWGSVVSTVFVYHGIWSANSVCHRFGTRRFPTRDDSRNNIFVALLIFGDGWHHNHHYVPWSARHGFRWWEVDLTYLILRALARLGLVWDLRLPPARACR